MTTTLSTAAGTSDAAELLAGLRTQARALDFALPDDAAYFARYSGMISRMFVERQLIERTIIRRAITDILAAGYLVSVHDGEGWATEDTADLATIMTSIMGTDDDTLRGSRPAKDDDRSSGHGKPAARVGSIHLIYGNDGWDVISDYHVALEDVLHGANALAEALSDNLL